MKATEQYFPMVLFIMLYRKVVVTFECVDEILNIIVTIQMKACTVCSFGAVYNDAQSDCTLWVFGCNPKCDHSNKTY